MYDVRRYQVYLDPHSVSILDDLEKEVDISRSKIIRDLVDRFARNIATLLPSQKRSGTPILDSLIGSIKIKGKKKTNYAMTVDDIYRRD